MSHDPQCPFKMSKSYPPVSLNGDDVENSPETPQHGLLGTSHLSRAAIAGRSRTGYSQVSEENSALASPAINSSPYPSPVLSSPGYNKADGIRDLQSMRRHDSVSPRMTILIVRCGLRSNMLSTKRRL